MSDDNTNLPEDPDRLASVRRAADILAAPAEIPDADPNNWLAMPSDMLGDVVVDSVRLKISALTEEETQRLMRMNTKPDPARPTDPPRLDPMRFRLALIAASLNKANPNAVQITPNQLGSRKTGSLTKIQDAIMRLSGMDEAAPTAAFFA